MFEMLALVAEPPAYVLVTATRSGLKLVDMSELQRTGGTVRFRTVHVLPATSAEIAAGQAVHVVRENSLDCRSRTSTVLSEQALRENGEQLARSGASGKTAVETNSDLLEVVCGGRTNPASARVAPSIAAARSALMKMIEDRTLP